jgi:acetyltransferase-like isoleucine patch superfamily enzyme
VDAADPVAEREELDEESVSGLDAIPDAGRPARATRVGRANLVDIRRHIRASHASGVYAWRRFALRLFGAQIGKDVLIRHGVRVTYPRKLVGGDNCWIGDGVRLYNIDEITLGDHTVVSQDAYLCSGTMTPETSPSR